MVKILEETLRKCRKCKKPTRHMRNATKPGFVTIVFHLIAILLTFGVWLIVIAVWRLLNTKFGGWVCAECGHK